jgi:hypothetical protein
MRACGTARSRRPPSVLPSDSIAGTSMQRTARRVRSIDTLGLRCPRVTGLMAGAHGTAGAAAAVFRAHVVAATGCVPRAHGIASHRHGPPGTAQWSDDAATLSPGQIFATFHHERPATLLPRRNRRGDRWIHQGSHRRKGPLRGSAPISFAASHRVGVATKSAAFSNG